jgi:hypothetical protein
MSKHELTYEYAKQIEELLRLQAKNMSKKHQSMLIELGDLAQRLLLLQKDNNYLSNAEWLETEDKYKNLCFLCDIQGAITGHAFHVLKQSETTYRDVSEFISYVKK